MLYLNLRSFACYWKYWSCAFLMHDILDYVTHLELPAVFLTNRCGVKLTMYYICYFSIVLTSYMLSLQKRWRWKVWPWTAWAAKKKHMIMSKEDYVMTSKVMSVSLIPCCFKWLLGLKILCPCQWVVNGWILRTELYKIFPHQLIACLSMVTSWVAYDGKVKLLWLHCHMRSWNACDYHQSRHVLNSACAHL